jgi:hypothetical protein
MNDEEISSAEVQRLASEILKKRGISEPVTRSILSRLRDQYVEIKPCRRIGPGLLLWPANMPDLVASVLEREAMAAR